jgi:hypothetical protein
MVLLVERYWEVEVVLCCLLNLAKVRVLVKAVGVMVSAAPAMASLETLGVALLGEEILEREILGVVLSSLLAVLGLEQVIWAKVLYHLLMVAVELTSAVEPVVVI